MVRMNMENVFIVKRLAKSAVSVNQMIKIANGQQKLMDKQLLLTKQKRKTHQPTSARNVSMIISIQNMWMT